MENIQTIQCTVCGELEGRFYTAIHVERRQGLIKEGEVLCEDCATKRKIEYTRVKKSADRLPYARPDVGHK